MWLVVLARTLLGHRACHAGMVAQYLLGQTPCQRGRFGLFAGNVVPGTGADGTDPPLLTFYVQCAHWVPYTYHGVLSF